MLVLQGVQCPNYNFTVMIFPLLVVALESKRQQMDMSTKRGKWFAVERGILLALGILSKQTVGGVFFVLYSGYLWWVKEEKNRSQKAKEILWVMVGTFSVLMIYFIYLLATNTLVAMLDQCFGSILDFSSKNKSRYDF